MCGIGAHCFKNRLHSQSLHFLSFLQFHPQIEINLVPDSVKNHFPVVKMFAWQFFLSFNSLKVWIFQTKISIPLYTLQFECQLIIFTQK